MSYSRQAAIRSNLEQRARVIDAVRAFFSSAGFLEIETPVRIPAPAPEIHIDAQETGDWFLQTSPELCMKRLLAAGYEKIFQICRCFRKGERGGRHVPEMTLLEWYAAGLDYLDLMTQCEELIGFVAARTDIGRRLVYQGQTVDLTPPWDRLTVAEAFERFGGMTVQQALDRECFDEIMGLDIEPQLGVERPLFLYDYPARCGALARLKPADPSVAERFELYIAGMELCNAFSELTDPQEQRVRFDADNRARGAIGKTVYPIAEPFLQALESMPSAAGIALGFDRLVMLLTGAASIDEVVAFVPEEL
ncbi:EF-P lysine aminoacylase EpmA [Desulfosarcina sp.]|uniref:EF-P lysine aminoacylase EpmA n=1 Tax=Desulfosarcina sp. TaxID=2027861 RepID=UPI0029B63A53|nr:EF-P lysine aminoacylase EpmA [Desulfosarcina sp.]MDX2451988.1 EF-P lysine aminoacylase EpmA [Desulfosarcina sp.]MDX2489772.1 EF-P lysine aminoacylase EpmA [Desulfosarcina sp.]